MGTWYPSGGGGGGGVEFGVYDATVSTEAALQAALTAGGNILVTETITLTDRLSLPGSKANRVRLPDGVRLIISNGGSGTYAPFEAASAGWDLEVRCGIDAGFEYDASSSGAALVVYNTAAGTYRGDVLCYNTGSGSWLGSGPFQTFNTAVAYLDRVLWPLQNAHNTSFRIGVSNDSYANEVVLVGGGSSCRVTLNSGQHWATVRLRGSWSNVGSSPSGSLVSSYTFSNGGQSVECLDLGYLSYPGVYVQGDIGLLIGGRSGVHIEFASSSSTVRPLTTTALHVRAGGLYAGYAVQNVVNGGRVSSLTPTLGTPRTGIIFMGTEIVGTFTTAGVVGCEFHGVRAEDVSITLADGSHDRWFGGKIDQTSSGTLTIEAGASARLYGTDLSAASITNNDPGTLITGSTDVSDDTDPTTRRFDNATLDALRPHIIAFWPGAELPEPSKAPVYGRSAAGSMLPLTSASVVGANGFDAPTTAEGFAAPCPFYFWSKFAEFTISFILRPVDATPAAGRSLIQWASQRNTLGFNVNYESTGQLNVFSNPTGGTPVVGASGFIGAFSDDTDTRVTFALRNNAGTGTIYGYADGVEVLTWTGFNAALMLEYLILASRSTGNLGFPAAYRDIYVFDIGLTEAQENLLDTNSLKGAGIA